jgi:transposase
MILGCDVGRDYVDMALVRRDLKPVFQGRIPNNVQALIEVMQQLKKRHPRMHVIVESTGSYQWPVIQAAHQLQIPVKLMNPIVTKQLTRASVRPTKTDKKDAVRIAQAGLQGAGYEVHAGQLETLACKTATRAADRLVTQETSLKLMQRYLGNLPVSIPTEALQECQKKLHETAVQYRTWATAQCDSETLELLCSIPGIGMTIATAIIAEVGDISRFKNGKAVVAYAGLDPRIRQSGTLLSYGKLSKRGSPMLRKYLFLAASVARRFDPGLKTKYELLRSRGKAYTPSVVHIARLLTYRIYAVMKQKRKYEVREPR